MSEKKLIRLLHTSAALALVLLCGVGWPASALAAEALTPNSRCGELATGLRADDKTTVATYQAPGLHVGADGVWTHCPEERPAPPPPKDCQVNEPRRWAECVDYRATGANIVHGNTVEWRQYFGAQRGQLIERCLDGRLVTEHVSCGAATSCDVALTIWHGPVSYSINATGKPVPVGQYAIAKAHDDTELRLQCVDGSFRPAPQCTRQLVAGPNGVQFSHTGPAVDYGRRFAIPAADGRLRPTGKPLTLAVTCDWYGRLVRM